MIGTRAARQRCLFAAALGAALVFVGARADPVETADDTAEIAAIERLLAAGQDSDALARAQVLAQPARLATLPAEREADIQLVLARALDRTEVQHEGVITATTRVLALLGPERADSPDAISARQLRGVANARLRNPEDALADLMFAVHATRERYGADSIEHADALYDLSLAQRSAADYGGAITSLETALAVRRKETPRNPVAIARGLIRLGQTQRISGDLERAEANYREALALDEAAPDPTGRNGAVVLYALGNLYRNRNDPDRAIAYYERAAPAFEKAYGADSPMLSVVLNNYGNAESLRPGRGDAAIALFQRALDIAERTHSQDPGHYMPIANIAMVRIWQGRYVEAEAGFRRALERFGNAPAGAETTPLFSQHGLAAALWGQGRHAEAFASAAEAEATRQAAVREVATGLSDQQALAFQEQDYATLDHAIAIALDSGDATLIERAWSLAIGARGQVTAIQAARLMQARASKDAKLRALWQEWLDASSALERARVGADAPARANARARLERAERRLAMALPQARELSTRAIGLDELRRALPPDTALIWLHDLEHQKPGDFANAAVDLEDPSTWAFVLPPGGGRVVAIELGPASVVAGELTQWLAAMANPASGTDLVRLRGAALAARVWAPIAKATTAHRIFVVAEGPLLRLPWPALPEGEGYLVESDRVFHVLNDERELLAPPARPRARHALLAVADPNGDALGAAAAGNRECADARTLPALPGARREVARLQTLLRDSDAAASVLALLGEAASEARFRREAPEASLVHLATHGIAADTGCTGAGTRGLSLSAEPAAKPAAPTALVLATPRDGALGSADDGLLGELEIAALDLSAVQWAVLAACSTAAGATHPYEGLYGLARAFRLGGVRTVLLSRWPVDDEATAEWSEALYLARLRDRADTPTAMQRAQRAVLAARRAQGRGDHPWYWAGFFALGDWR
jgi:CHAT domain-containing protein/tetratricopeptide (TPR) repeat protein